MILGNFPDITFELKPKVFKTGSKGYQASGTAGIEGKTFQVNILLIEKGSKPKPEDQDDEDKDD